MGVFGAIIEVSMLPMFHAGEELPFGRAVARQSIRDDHPGTYVRLLRSFRKNFLAAF
jgi:hypothetical protein